MSSLYKKNGVYYLSVNFDGVRKTTSLKTKHESVARELRPRIEIELQRELRGWQDSRISRSTMIQGEIGELYTKIDLLKRNLYPTKVEIDDDGVDFIVEKRRNGESKFITLQIKYSSRSNSKNSIMFDVKKSRADWVAFVTEIQQPNGLISPIVMYMKNKRINKRWTMNIKVKDLDNNRQNKLVHKWTDFINPNF